jgi:hypothetical protein
MDPLANAVRIPPTEAVLDIDCAFGGDYPELIVSGWRALPEPRIERVSLVDGSGMLVPVPFQSHVEPHPEGNLVLERRPVHRSEGIRFTLRIDSFGVEDPTALWLEMEDEVSYCFDLRSHLSVQVPEGAKRRLLQSLMVPDQVSPAGSPNPSGSLDADQCFDSDSIYVPAASSHGTMAPAVVDACAEAVIAGGASADNKGVVSRMPHGSEGPENPLPELVGPLGQGKLEIDRAFTAENGELVVVGWLAAARPDIQRVAVVDQHGTAVPVAFRQHAQARPDVAQGVAIPSGASCVGFELLANFSGLQPPTGLRLQLSDGECYSVDLRRHLAAPVPRTERHSSLRSLHETCETAAGARALGLGDGTVLMGSIDLWHRINDQVTAATGWCRILDDVRTNVMVRTAKGGFSCDPDHIITYRRQDEGRPPVTGFMIQFHSAEERPASLHFEDKTGVSWTLSFPPTPLGRDEWIQHINSQYAECARQYEFLPEQRSKIDDFFVGLVSAVRSSVLMTSGVLDEDRFGPKAIAPAVSVLVPLAKSHPGLTPLRMQKLTADPFVRQQELLFVAEAGPEVAVHLRSLARWHRMYGTCARLLVVGKGTDLGGAVNLGASAATAPHLLLLGPQTVPGPAGWLELLLEDCRRDPTVAAVGARLIHFDGSVHHIGIGWRPDPAGGEFPVPMCPFRGLDQKLVSLFGVVDVPAVSAACLLAPTAVFESVGMFDSYFLGGECVDTDYCLRARKKGRRVLCDHRALLYYADAAQEAPTLPAVFRRYNTLRFHRRWKQAITEEFAITDQLFRFSP